MSDLGVGDLGDTPSLQVAVYRDGAFVERIWCDSEAQAAEVAASWEESPGVECVVGTVSGVAADAAAFEVDSIDDIEEYPPGEAGQ